MDVEFATDYLCRRFLHGLSPVSTGVVLEIGLGSSSFSFLWASPLGYRCLAVEPLPTENLLHASKVHNVELLQAAVGAQSGDVPIYHGIVNGYDLPDISSLNPRWWGVSDRTTIVPSLTLPEICTLKSIGTIAFLKIDTEGSESDILSLLPDLSHHLKPLLISVEYGGGGSSLASKKGGWASEFFDGTRRLLEITEREGYAASIVLESNRLLPSLRRGSSAFDIKQLFEPDFLVGNLLIIRNPSDATNFSTLIRSSILAFFYSHFKCQLRDKTNDATFLLSRIKQKLICRNLGKS
jgi:FkbM family methyltransferase